MWQPMKPFLFSEIIKHLMQNYTVVPIEYFLQDTTSFQTDRRIATVLFDDGYKDNIEFAAPILKKFKCPASFYVVTDCIDRNIPTWTYIVDNIFQKTKKEKLELSYEFVPEKFKSVCLNNECEQNPMIKEVKPWLKRLSNPQRVLIVQSLLDQCDDVPIPGNKMMGWKDVCQLAAEGFIIGSHSHTHPLLASLQSETEIADELRISGKRIQEETGKFPLTISYPNGSFDERVIRLSANEGYKYGQAVEQKFFDTAKINDFKIPRVELYQEPWWKVRMRISGMYGRIKKILA